MPQDAAHQGAPDPNPGGDFGFSDATAMQLQDFCMYGRGCRPPQPLTVQVKLLFAPDPY